MSLSILVSSLADALCVYIATLSLCISLVRLVLGLFVLDVVNMQVIGLLFLDCARIRK